MSRRFLDSLEVLDLIRDFSKNERSPNVTNLRLRALDHVASRGVDRNTVYAHLIGKNTPYTLSSRDIDKLINSWLVEESDELEKWMTNSSNTDFDKGNIRQFFSSQSSSPIASDIEEPSKPERINTSIYRILRDTALARRIKSESGYICQLCNQTIKLNNDKLYAEAHHLKPLGSPYNGQDIPGNIICVCPNCHVKLDYGAIQLDMKTFDSIHEEFVHYHNSQIFRNIKV